ncbi:MAG: bifunctional (p)ppGpp synthetase/guanosine-3',5'-bis(diphosphate) 3'-pyrophosphohydrolase [Paludibacteraceae bacterium]|nr:bifunctional (p)ppGpp synthetase/guanosine-3',5'-bis(diphosphate) 3'-pyrophosphohydrolase [Paludibacteraceae bacterium]MBR1716000.1 bifunctional (p)ppGpp synthetase/guanosine-3',5'-bis(diphosphate) 3'-pyrophosphohydrolase [Paludibacteraceae bacterium]
MEDSNKVLFQILTNRLDLLRELDKEGDSDRRRHIARETQKLHAPMAHKLGLYQIKTEMEDLSLKFLEYDQYKYIAHALNAKRAEREEYIARFIAPLEQKLKDAGFVFTIKGRPKSIHSIYHKMQAQHCDVDKIYDLFAIRIILDTPPEREKSDCWMVYSMITDIFRPDPRRLRDWLSNPKENGYESLHTTVKGFDDRWVEIQIRSKRMDEVAEKGVAAHWAYKGVKGNVLDLDKQYVYAFTPTGDLRRLPFGATVLDFAYSIHSDVGSHCSGGRIRNQQVSIRQVIQNGDQVEIMTSPNQKPNADWLSFVKSTKAKNKIRQQLKEIEYKNAAEGRELLERRFKNWKIEYNETNVARLSDKLGYKAVSDFYQTLASGKEDLVRLRDIYLALDEQPQIVHTERQEYIPQEQLRGLAIEVDINVKNVDYNLSRCCNPQPGDPIFGFISVTKGIRIHRIDCPNADNIRERYPYRVIPARWAKKDG